MWILAARTRRYRRRSGPRSAATLVWCAVNMPVAVAYPTGWWEFYRFSADRPTEASTFWAIAHYLSDVGFFGQGYARPGRRPASRSSLLSCRARGRRAARPRAPTRPRMAQLAFLVVLAFLLTTKVWSPQYSIWLVPLLALARPRWGLNLLWQFSEIAVWIATLLWLLGYYDSARGLDYGALMIVLSRAGRPADCAWPLSSCARCGIPSATSSARAAWTIRAAARSMAVDRSARRYPARSCRVPMPAPSGTETGHEPAGRSSEPPG